MNLTRRALLQQTSLAAASIGLSQVGLSFLTRRYQRVLATPTSRRLALLIGIDQYTSSVCGFSSSSSKDKALQGAVTDVELHRELLISRFGFHPSDIVTLTDQQATRDGIETALQFHLLDQVKAGDVVVFHFSGLGSFIQAPQNPVVADPADPSAQEAALRRSLVPVDGTLPTASKPDLMDVMQGTLALCLKALPTQNIVSLLDVGYGYPTPLLGNLRVRSRLNPLQDVVIGYDSALYQRLAKRQPAARLKTSERHDLDFPGVLFSGANLRGVATEASWDGFSAGLFTYHFTQQLWCTTSAMSIHTALAQTSGAIEQWVGSHHQPLFTGLDASNDPMATYLNVPTASVPTASVPAASVPTANASTALTSTDGVLLEQDIEKNSFSLWMAGLPALVLEQCSLSSYWECVPPQRGLKEGPRDALSPSPTLLEGRSRTGLMVTARRVTSDPAVGEIGLAPRSFIHERVRGIPKALDLAVALDYKLERIERVDATSAFSAVDNVASVTAGEQMADCLFGKINTADIPKSSLFPLNRPQDSASPDKSKSGTGQDASIQQRYGLFRPGRSLILNTLIQTEEAVKTAIHRIEPQLQSLLAAKFLQLSVNATSSFLGLQATLVKMTPNEQVLMQQYPPRASNSNVPMSTLGSGSGRTPQLAVGDKIQFQLKNYSSSPLYYLLLNIDSRGNIVATYPSRTTRSSVSNRNTGELPDAQETNVLSANAITTVPHPEQAESWTIDGPPGLVTTYIIVSCAPFTETMKQLTQLKKTGNARAIAILSQPLPFVKAVLRDLSNASQLAVRQLSLESSSDRYLLATDCWVTFNFTYEVSES